MVKIFNLMNMNRILALTIALQAFSSPAFAGGKSVYGTDDREELFEASPMAARLADSVVSIWKSENVRYNPASGDFSLKTRKLAEEYHLCPGEKFGEQQEGAECSGALIGEDLVLTTGHCSTDACGEISIIFGFAYKRPGDDPAAGVPGKDVYSCKRLIARRTPQNTSGLDFALIQLDREVAGHKILARNRGAGPKKGDWVTLIGHPLGLPLKISPDGTIRDASPEGYFTTDLDSFYGNSGSPVFNTVTGLLEGILVRGGEDTAPASTGCNTLVAYPQNGGRGETVTMISAIEPFLPKFPPGI
ncbi:MAG: serine protease [Elusimicrobiales bacterium]|jgi:S1-C subfamily serine protease